jgi:cell division protein FtsL
MAGKDAEPTVIHKAVLTLAVLNTLVVAGITVHLQVQARLRTYELARTRQAVLEMEEAADAVRARVVAIWVPERVSNAAGRLRAERRAIAEARAEGTVAQL